MTTRDDPFERAAAYGVDEAAVREAFHARRTERETLGDGRETADDAKPREDTVATNREPSPARVVADADVLVADLLCGGDARRALDRVREHSWMTLVASDPLLDEAEAVIAELAEAALASDWRATVEALRERASHPPGDHPALASAYRGGAMHVLTFDERLLGARAGAALRDRVEASVRRPDAFAALFDAESLYREVVGGDYPGPDRDPQG